MATRMQQRRGTAAQWTAANPVLAAGEIGFETDTNKFKMGNGSSAWSALQYFANAAELAAIIDGAPDLLNTLNELAAAIGDDPSFLTTVATNLSTHASDTSSVHGIADTTVLVTQTDLTNAINNAEVNQADLAGVGIDWNPVDERFDIDSTVATKTYADNSVTVHSQDTTGVHGIEDTANLVTLTGSQSLTNKTLQSPVINTPTGITKVDVGLGNLDNTADLDKPVSTATQTALNLKANSDSPTFTGNVVGITKSMVGLSNVDNSSDADKPVSTLQQTALDLKANLDSPTFTGTVGGITKAMIGLANADNTSDSDKPVSMATDAALGQKLNLSGGTLTGALTLNADPSNALHAATKQYVDAATAGLNVHASVKAATTENITLSTAVENGDTLDGVTLATGDRILVKNQTTKSQNGVYIVAASGAPTRATDYDSTPEVDAGDFIFVESGTQNAKTGWVQTNAITTIGTDDIEFTQFSGSGTFSAGDGLTLTGTSFSVNNTIARLASPTFTGTVSGITKSMVGLGNVDNTSDANKPVSTATQTALDLKANLASPTFTGTVSGVTKAMVGLGNVDNTSDANKPVSTATQTALDLKAPIASPTFTGTVTVAASGIAFTDGTQTKEGVPSRTTIIPKTANYTLSSLGERDCLIEMGSGSALTLTIPTNATVAWPIGTSIDVLQTGAGQVTIAGAAGVTVNATPGLKLRTQWSSATLMKRATDAWVVVGDLTA